MSLAITAAEILGVLLVAALVSMRLIGWVDARTDGITAEQSRLNSSVQAVVTTVAFSTVYGLHGDGVPATTVGAGIALLFGLALGGEIQAERLHRASTY